MDLLRISRFDWRITAKVSTFCLLLTLTDDTQTATSVDEPVREHLPQPSILRAPEVTLRYPWTSTIDIWTVGCLVRWVPTYTTPLILHTS